MKPLLPAIVVSSVVVLWSPLAGQVRAGLSEAFPARFPLLVNGAIALAVAGAVVAGLGRMRERRGLRMTLVAAAVAAGAAAMAVTGTGSAEVDAVERFHFVEYGLVTWLFHRVFRPRADASALVLPACAALLVAMGDEWVQWFVPGRVGELRDVVLDTAAVGCGLLASLGIDPPERLPLGLGRGSAVRVGLAFSLVILAAAAFVQSVHLGYRVDDPTAGSFESRYTRAALRRLAADRAARWASRSPLPQAPWSREDQYLAEALWHVRVRNDAWEAGDTRSAWRENLILERYYGPALDVRPKPSGRAFRWSAAQRADAETRGRKPGSYVSPAAPTAIVTWSRSWFWGIVAAASGATLVPVLAAGRRRAGRGDRRPATSD